MLPASATQKNAAASSAADHSASPGAKGGCFLTIEKFHQRWSKDLAVLHNE